MGAGGVVSEIGAGVDGLLTVTAPSSPASATELRAMGSAPTWTAWSVITAVLLLSPALALLTVIAVELLIDLLMEAGTTAVCALAAGAIGWVLYRKRSPHPKVAPHSELEQLCDEPAIAVPPL